MVGFILLPLFPIDAFIFAVIGIFTGLFAHFKGGTLGMAAIILGFLLAVLSIVFTVYYLTILPLS